MISFLNKPELPRGLRNNNPGNLIITGYDWLGKIPVAQNTDGRFEQFTSANYGIRAMAMDVLNDFSEGTDTLRKLVTEYAPASENNTAAYINYIAEKTGTNPDAPLVMNADNLTVLLQSFIRMENGESYGALIPVAEIQDSIRLLPALILQRLGDFAKDNAKTIAVVLTAAVLTGYAAYKYKNSA